MRSAAGVAALAPAQQELTGDLLASEPVEPQLTGRLDALPPASTELTLEREVNPRHELRRRAGCGLQPRPGPRPALGCTGGRRCAGRSRRLRDPAAQLQRPGLLQRQSA
ncbi:MAG: hypothetical protein V9H69_21195 [Anaerolineae bacterium]